jgi:hypothetical protein
MEAVSYVNIFETKGLEYLLVISFLVGFVLLVRYLGEAGAGAAAASRDGAVAGPDHATACPAPVDCPYRTSFPETTSDRRDLDREEGAA